jgi:hypothetical protein
MTGRQRVKLVMFEQIESVCAQYRHVWGDLAAFRTAFASFQTELRKLAELARAQRRHTGGAAQEKVNARANLCVIAYELASAIRAHALASGDTKAAAKLAYSLTQLRIGKDNLCLERCRQILASARNHLQKLEPYGVTEQRITDMAGSLDKFATHAEQTRTIRSANKVTTGQLPAAFKAVEVILYDQLDNLMPQFRAAAPRLYNQYQESRVMKPQAGGAPLIVEPEPEDPPLLD